MGQRQWRWVTPERWQQAQGAQTWSWLPALQPPAHGKGRAQETPAWGHKTHRDMGGWSTLDVGRGPQVGCWSAEWGYSQIKISRMLPGNQTWEDRGLLPLGGRDTTGLTGHCVEYSRVLPLWPRIMSLRLAFYEILKSRPRRIKPFPCNLLAFQNRAKY